MTLVLLILSIALFTAASGFFSASETSLFSLSSMRIRSYKESDKPRKTLIASLVSRPRELLVTILMMNVAVNIMVQNVTSNLFADVQSWTLSVGVPFALTLVFGEIIPKSLAIQNNTWLADHVAPVIYFFQRALGPLRHIVVATTSLLSKIMFFWLRDQEAISAEELRHMLSHSEEHGVLSEEEAELVEGYLDLQMAQVKELMRPREEMLCYDINAPIEELLELFDRRECSRVPVFDGELQNMLGIMSADQYFRHRQAIHRPDKLRTFLQKPFYSPETTPARKLLRQLSQQRRQMALVVDEYGAVSGLITLEDLYETVVGEIKDQRDPHELFSHTGPDTIIANGKLELADFEEIFDINLESPNNMVTVGGWLTEALGDIPKAGTNYVSNGLLFHVLAANRTRVQRIYIRRMQTTSGRAKL